MEELTNKLMQCTQFTQLFQQLRDVLGLTQLPFSFSLLWSQSYKYRSQKYCTLRHVTDCQRHKSNKKTDISFANISFNQLIFLKIMINLYNILLSLSENFIIHVTEIFFTYLYHSSYVRIIFMCSF